MATKAERRAAHKERVRRRKLREIDRGLSDVEQQIIAEDQKVDIPTDATKYARRRIYGVK